MRLNAKTEYACLAMLQLAADQLAGDCADGPTPIRTLSERQTIPEGFLVQILQDLRRAGLVISTRGSCGGYRLARPATEISLAEVIAAIEGQVPVNSPSENPLAEALQGVCEDLRQVAQDRLEGLSLADLVDQAAAPVEPMWYI